MDVLPPPTLSEDLMATLNAASRLTYFVLSHIYSTVRFPAAASPFQSNAGCCSGFGHAQRWRRIGDACKPALSAGEAVQRPERADVMEEGPATSSGVRCKVLLALWRLRYCLRDHFDLSVQRQALCAYLQASAAV